MANSEHVEILKQGVEVWNKWRRENPDVEPNLIKADLAGKVLINADLEKADLKRANLTRSFLSGADLMGANLARAKLARADLMGAKLFFADLTGTDLTQACLIYADFSNAEITGAYLYGTARDDWKIDGIKCNYVYWGIYPHFPDQDENEQWLKDNRTPKDRDFRPGEFEELYKSLPTFEYHFEHGFTPIDSIAMDQVVKAVNEKHPEFELRLDSFHSRGQPHAKFTVLHKENIEEVRRQVASEYEGKIKYLEGQRDQILELFTKTINEPRTVIGQVTGSVSVNKKEIEHMSGDTFNVSNVSGANINLKSHMENVQQNIVNAIRESDASDDLKTKLEELAKAVEAMTGGMPEGQAKEVKDDLALLVKGAVEKKPKWYSISGESLIEAAKAVGSLGKPVVELAQSVLKLLP